MTKRASFFLELKRRNVLRSAALYLGVAWAAAQGISQLAPSLGLPSWTPRAVLIACAVVFPIWVAFGWFYELTPSGFKPDSTIPKDSPLRKGNARKLDFAIIGVLSVIVVLLASGYFLRTTPLTPTARSFDPPTNSIVVLPFANLDNDPKQKYFSNGITEELTDALGQNTGLTVIAWNTASRYAGSKQSPIQIGRTLNVAHALAGNIQRAGDTLRVTTELIDTRDGRQLWSAHYDDSLEHIFAVQDKISAAIAQALKVRFAGMQSVPTLNPRAHDFYLKGLATLDGVTAADAQAAHDYFQQALQLDPKYADAWAGLSASYLALSQFSTLPLAQATPKMREAARKALELDPRNVNALVELGNADNADGNASAARSEYERAIKLDPNNARAHLDYGTVLPLEQDLVQTREAARLDPGSGTAQNNLATIYQEMGNWPGMVEAGQALHKLSPHGIDSAFYLAFAYHRMQRGADAVKAFDQVQTTDATDQKMLQAGRLTYQALLDPSLRPRALDALAKLLHADASPFSQGNLLLLYLELGEKKTAMKLLPAICAAAPVGCNDLAINPMYAPLHGDPQFEALAKKYSMLQVR